MREYVTSYKECETTDHVKYTLPIEKNEEVVRCRDCKHRAGANVQAVISDLCMWLDIIVKPDDFCAWGERSEP